MAQNRIRTGILVEIEENLVKDTSLGVMTAAAGQEIYALVPLDDISAVKDKLAEYGADYIVSMKGMAKEKASPDFQAGLLVEAVKEYQFKALIGTASAQGKDLFARTAAILDEALISDCIQLDIEGKKAVKSHFSGKTFATLKVNGTILLSTVRPNAIEAIAAPAKGEVLDFDHIGSDPGMLTIVDIKKEAEGKLDLIEAPVVISGGRALGAAENFDMLESCAEKLGAAVGASRAAVDAGFAPHTIQVGQTGKTVSPRLYIACGISGAVQHFAGMQTSKVIVAINKDKDAPIFSKCDYGIVGDIFEVVPKLTEKL
jgi:electron transfer flavoprotein alpha subunit